MKKLLLFLLVACKSQTSQIKSTELRPSCAILEEAGRQQEEMKREYEQSPATGKRYFDLIAYDKAHENLRACR